MTFYALLLFYFVLFRSYARWMYLLLTTRNSFSPFKLYFCNHLSSKSSRFPGPRSLAVDFIPHQLRKKLRRLFILDCPRYFQINTADRMSWIPLRYVKILIFENWFLWYIVNDNDDDDDDNSNDRDDDNDNDDDEVDDDKNDEEKKMMMMMTMIVTMMMMIMMRITMVIIMIL